MISGGAWGGACDLAMSCDILMGGPSAAFCMTPAKVGIPYNVTGVLHFMNVVGVNRVKEMFFTARALTADEAQAWPEPDRARAGAGDHHLRHGREHHAQQPPGIAAMKEQFRILADAYGLAPTVFERIQGLRRMVYDSRDYAEGLLAIKEKRDPVFKGE